MVDWMDPRQLARTGLRAVLSATFGSYADKREVQAALFHGRFNAKTKSVGDREDGILEEITPIPEPDGDYADSRGAFWIDFVADLGDGFDATYTIARLLAEPALNINGQQLSRGNVLVLGGDQVYPTASREEYRDKFEGPYTAALPCVPNEEIAPCLYAVPGNHDWYDGLTSFLRLFCHQRWIGGWRTQQKRSYFAVKLPHRWWLWGIDIQLAADIDLPQIEFFEKIADDDPHFAGSNVILCTGTPSWTDEIRKKKNSDRLEGGNGYANLGFFEKRVIVKRGAEPVLTLTGDDHHYCRYAGHHPETEKQRHKITAGGGGAYLLGTHSMPDEIELDDSLKDEDPPVVYKRGPALFPTRKESFRLTLAALQFPWKGRKLAFLLGAIYLLNAWIIQSASKKYSVSLFGEITDYPLSWSGLTLTLGAAWKALAHSPATVTLWLIIVAGFVAFAGKGARIAGLLHAGVHLLTNLLLAWVFALLNFALFFRWFNEPGARRSDVAETIFDSASQTLLFTGEMLIIGMFVAGCIFGLYLVVCALIPPRYPHINEAFSSQAIPDFKNFLRMKIDATGALTLFPIGVRKICRWNLRDKATEKPADHEPWFKPQGDIKLDSLIELIEGPLEFGAPRQLDGNAPEANGRTGKSSNGAV
jgi:Calcineurin-like phosphoesterase